MDDYNTKWFKPSATKVLPAKKKGGELIRKRRKKKNGYHFK